MKKQWMLTMGWRIQNFCTLVTQPVVQNLPVPGHDPRPKKVPDPLVRGGHG